MDYFFFNITLGNGENLSPLLENRSIWFQISLFPLKIGEYDSSYDILFGYLYLKIVIIF
jgi:hypothetical protein